MVPDYLYVHSSITSEFLSYLKMEIREQFSLDPRSSPDYPRLVNAQAVERLAGYLSSGQVAIGGEYDSKQCYFAPTILTEVAMDSPVMQDEIFGPVLPFLKFNDLNQVLQTLQKQEIPLALYYFSQDKKKVEKVLAQTRSGGVTVNDTLLQVISSDVPFGGVGNSGLGNYHGYASFLTFTHERSVIKKSTCLEVKTRFAPSSPQKLATLKKLIK